MRSALLLAVLLSACGDGRVIPLRSTAVRVFRVEHLPGAGWSGLGVVDGALIASAERGDLVTLRVDGDRIRPDRTIPVAQWPEGLDKESIDGVGPGLVVIGTERKGNRHVDSVVQVRVGPDGAEAIAAVELPYNLWATSAKDNQGIEGICAVDGRVVAAVEGAWIEGGDRWGLLARYDAGARQWQAFRTALGTDKGKLAGLACEAQGDGVRVWAIERHHGIARVLQLDLPPWTPTLPEASDEDAQDLDPKVAPATVAPPVVPNTVVFDIAAAVGEVPNLEGIVRWEGGLLLLSDNQNGGKVSGPTEAIWLPLPPG